MIVSKNFDLVKQITYQSNNSIDEYCYIDFRILRAFNIDYFFIGIDKIIRSNQKSSLLNPLSKKDIFLSKLFVIPAFFLYIFFVIFPIWYFIFNQVVTLSWVYLLVYLLVCGVLYFLNQKAKHYFTVVLPQKRGWNVV
jgi:hypothetical protein